MQSYSGIPDTSKWLLAAVFVTLVLWQLPFGYYLLYPFTILATWFHEMGHGLTGILMGGSFYELVLEPNGSGFALMEGPFLFGRIGEAIISANGPLGPAFVGAGMILASRSDKATRICLMLLSAAMFISLLIWVRSPTGWVVLPILGASIAAIANFGKVWMRALAIQFIGLQAVISMFLQWDYLFSYAFSRGGEVILSDTGQMSEITGLPHWAWAGLILFIAAWVLTSALKSVYGDKAYRRRP